MILEFHDSFRRPTRVQATRLVVYDDLGNPIGAFVQRGPAEIFAELISDDEARFERLLGQLGIRHTVIVDRINTKNLRPS